MQGCVLKAVGAISKVTNILLELKNSKNLNIIALSKNLSTMVHDCTDSLALISQPNTELEQNSRDYTTYYLDDQYHALIKNFPADSEFLFCDDLPKRIMNVTANKRLFSSSKTSFQSYNTSFKSSKKQNGHQIRTGQYQKQYSSSHSNKYPKQNNIKIGRSS